jgi:D-glycerate 3-kinase
MITPMWIDAFLREHRLAASYANVIRNVHLPLAARLHARAIAKGAAPLVVGICGSQGSGKSTLAASLQFALGDRAQRAASLSLDDLYLGRRQRIELSDRVHPLFWTRGVPGTHDVTLGLDVIQTLVDGRRTALPRFDKARDDRSPRDEWPTAESVNVVLFEGWCVGAKPQEPGELVQPINDLEAMEDPQGIWRSHVNTALGGKYQRLFGMLDVLVLLRAPSFECVYGWRRELEEKLRAQRKSFGSDTHGLMDDAQLRRFVAHFERLTRHILHEMPARADVVMPVERATGALDVESAT